MSFEPDTNDIRIRQLKEEIARIREEQFARAFPTNLGGSPSVINSDSGVPAPAIGVTSIIPAVIRITKDTGVIDLLNFDGKSPTKDFTISEVITGQISGATATIGDIDTLTTSSGVLTLVSSSITGTFNDGENLNGSIGGTNIADADGTQFTQTGRGHLNAGAGSIIADADSIAVPFEIHFIDNAEQDGQVIYLRAQDGQTIKLRRPTTADGTTGNLDLDESFNTVENAIVLFQYQSASNATPTGGWVPQISEVTAGVTGGTAFTFPILYPKENLGTLSGVIDLALNQSDGHYKQITLDGDASLTFSNLPPAINGFKFYVLTIQDGTGGHVYTDLPDSVIFEGVLLGQLQTGANAQTLWQFSTADGGVNWHSAVINPQGSIGQNQTPWLSDIDASTFDLFNADKIIFFGAGGFSFPTDATIQGISTSGTGLQRNVPLSQSHQWFVGGDLLMQLTSNGGTSKELKMFESFIENTSGISFFHPTVPTLSSIIPVGEELRYDISGVGTLHAFRVGIPIFPQFEIREDVIRANVDLDMITNDINNVDQIQFDGAGGFEPLVNHGERRLTGGALGISMNIPKITPFAGGFNIFFENDAQDNSDLIYRFEKNRLLMPTCAFIESSLGYLLCNGGGLTDEGVKVVLNTGQNPSTFDPQILELAVSNLKKVEFTNLEDGTGGVGGGMKMFTDLNMQTFNIHNLDILEFEPDVGTGIGGLGNGSYGIVADETKSLTLGIVPSGVNTPIFLFHAPSGISPNDPVFAWGKNHIVFATLDEGDFHLFENPANLLPFITSDGGFRYGLSHDPAFNPAIDGDSRLINNAGSLDVVFRTGGNLVNLSDLTGVGSAQSPWLSDIDADENDLFDINKLKGRDTGTTGSFRIVFDANEDEDTWIGDDSGNDTIAIFTNNFRLATFSPFGLSMIAGPIDVNRNFVEFTEQFDVGVPQPGSLIEGRVFLREANGELSIRKGDGSIVSLEAGGAGGDLWSDPVDSDIIPDTDDLYLIGNSSFRFRQINLGGLTAPDGRGINTAGGIRQSSASTSNFFGANTTFNRNVDVNVDFKTHGLLTRLGDNTVARLDIRASVTTGGNFGNIAFVPFSVGGRSPNLLDVGLLRLEQIELRTRTPPAIVTRPFPIIFGSSTVGQRIGFYTQSNPTISNPHGSRGAMQMPTTFVTLTSASSADANFSGFRGCFAMDNDNGTPRLLFRSQNGTWYTTANPLVQVLI